MITLDEKSIDTLELPDVLFMLSEEAGERGCKGDGALPAAISFKR